MLSLPTSTKIGAAAAVVALGLSTIAATPAQASYIAQRCNDDGCYRVRCHDDGFGCIQVSGYYDSDYAGPPRHYIPADEPYYHARARYLCSSDGEDCRWTNTYNDAVGDADDDY
ncbi:MAG TPA: hypothetical protein VGG10_17170 [Rhizomicrobium sp.]|jgi:hypothetical protein